MIRQNLSEISMRALAMVNGDAENGSMMKKKLMCMMVDGLTFTQNLKGNLKGKEKTEF